MGRGKIEIKRIENSSNRQVTFSKRKQGILKKAKEISVLCDANVFLILFSSAGKMYEYTSPSANLENILTRYQTASGKKLWDARHEYLNHELDRIKKEHDNMQIELRHLNGEDLSSLSVIDLRNLEDSLQIGYENVILKKTQWMYNELERLKQNGDAIDEENRRLRCLLKQQDAALCDLTDFDLGSNKKGKGNPSHLGMQPFGFHVQPIQPNLQHNKFKSGPC
uniref:PISTILLATA-like protein n=1 Tax=Brasenia schreberi TaxID=4424 RepID=Q68BH0_BRASC|nr:PISTILLATA-like protein [Brasenia schreberi]